MAKMVELVPKPCFKNALEIRELQAAVIRTQAKGNEKQMEELGPVHIHV